MNSSIRSINKLELVLVMNIFINNINKGKMNYFIYKLLIINNKFCY